LEAGASKSPYVMPVPFFNVLNGGVHSGNTMAFQEIMLAPTGATSITEAVQMGAETYHTLSKVIAKKFGPSGIFYLPLNIKTLYINEIMISHIHW
jgi:enolase